MPSTAGQIWNGTTVASCLRRRARITLAIELACAAVALLLFLGHVLAFPGHGDDWNTFNGRTLAFVSACDGESIQVAQAAGKTPVVVRLIGVARMSDEWDRLARSAIDAMLRDKKLTLQLEATQTRDSAGRLLASAFTPDGKSLSAELVRQGLALADRRTTYAFHGAVEQAETEARKKTRGLWKTSRDTDMPAWRQQWLTQSRAGFLKEQ